MAPHIASEVYENYFGEDLIKITWPLVDTENLKDPTYELVIQINGKKRFTRETDIGLNQSEVERICKLNEDDLKSIYKDLLPKVVHNQQKIFEYDTITDWSNLLESLNED